MPEFDFENIFNLGDSEEDTKYTTKVNVPQYLPSGECPRLHEVINLNKYKELLRDIENSSVTDEEKEFLRFAATRHIVFTYAKIADYYAHASKEMQELMEKSALVIIDFEDAIANGYVKLSKNIENIMKATGRQAGTDFTNQTTKKA